MSSNENYLIRFLSNRSKKAMVCIDWANVYKWEITKRKERVVVEEQKVDPVKLYNFLKKINPVKEIKLFYGLDKAREDVLDNVVRWIEKRVSKKPANISELYQEIEKIRKKEKLSDALWLQVKEVLDEYFSTKRLEEFEKTGFDISNQKNVKSFSNSLYHLSKFKTILEKLDKIIDNILTKESKCLSTIEKDLITQIRELKTCLKQKIKDRKCDFDVDIVVEIMRHIDEYDTFIIFSGDGDFAPSIRFFREKLKNIVIVSQSNKLGKEIVDLADRDKPIVIFSERIDEIWSKKIPRR